MSWEPLRQHIERHLSLEELRTLCFDLDIDFDSLGGDGKEGKVRELLAHCRRTNQVPQLLTYLARRRPVVDWRSLTLDTTAPASPSDIAPDPHSQRHYDSPQTPIGQTSPPFTRGHWRARPAVVLIGAIAGIVSLIAIVLQVLGPDGLARRPSGRLLFTTVRYQHEDLCVVNPDGTGFQRLTSTGDNGAASWSPDGTQIAFYSNMEANDGTFAIYVMNADGTDVRKMTTATGWNGGSTWSPDGRYIAFESDRQGENRHTIYVLDVVTGEERSLDQLGRSPAWAPDSKRLAFQSDRDGTLDIYTLNIESGALARLTADPDEDVGPSWSPDGESILFSTRRAGTEAYDLFRVDASGMAAKQRFTNTADIYPSPVSWSPDGRQIAFTAFVEGKPDVFTMQADGTRRRRVDTGGLDNTGPVWSPR